MRAWHEVRIDRRDPPNEGQKPGQPTANDRQRHLRSPPHRKAETILTKSRILAGARGIPFWKACSVLVVSIRKDFFSHLNISVPSIDLYKSLWIYIGLGAPPVYRLLGSDILRCEHFFTADEGLRTELTPSSRGSPPAGCSPYRIVSYIPSRQDNTTLRTKQARCESSLKARSPSASRPWPL